MNHTNALNARISAHPFFRGLSLEHLAIISHGAAEARFNTGEVLFLEGKPANQFYLIENGSVALEAHHSGTTIPVQTLGRGEVLGWSWLFSPFTWNFRATAKETTTAIVLSGAHLLANAERNHDFGYELMKRVTRIVIHRLQTSREQLLLVSEEAAGQKRNEPTGGTMERRAA